MTIKIDVPRERGFTLVELMVTLALGLFLAFGLIRVFASSNDSYYALSQAAEQIENGRYAMDTLKKDLMHAGYYGEFAFAAATGTVLPNPCVIPTDVATTATVRSALPFHIQGYDSPATPPIGCIDDDNHVANTDILVIRRVGTNFELKCPTPPAVQVDPVLKQNELYLQATAVSTDSSNPVLGLSSGAWNTDKANFSMRCKDGSSFAEIRKYILRIYYISPCSVPASGTVCGADADGGRPIPTLKRLDLSLNGGALSFRTETIAEGIENLQIDYGVDTDGDGLADGNFVTTPPSVDRWGDVVAAHIHLLARNIRISAGHTDTKTYNLGVGGSVTPGGNFRRHAFTAQVRLVNPAARRELP